MIFNSSNMTSKSYLPPISFTLLTTSPSHSDLANKMKLKKKMDTTNNPDLFLVNLWAEKIYRLHPYPVFYLHWPASKLFDGIFLSNITSLDVIKIIHSSARATRKDKPGFTEDDMGTQSNRLSAAMDMYLSKCTSFHNNTNWPLIL